MVPFDEFCLMIDDYIERGQLPYSRMDILYDMTNNSLAVNEDGFIIYGINRGECWIHHTYSRKGHDIKKELSNIVYEHAKKLGCKKIFLITPHDKFVCRKWRGFKTTGQTLLEMEVT